jgi:autotransporter-associated beta strand protein
MDLPRAYGLSGRQAGAPVGADVWFLVEGAGVLSVGATINNASQVWFFDTSTAENAQITNNGMTQFFGSSSAGSSTITNNAGSGTQFSGSSSAGNSTINVNANGGLQFLGNSDAGSATITTSLGAVTQIIHTATGGNARFVTQAGGLFDISRLDAAGATAGSIEGAGAFAFGSKNLVVGSNDLNTTVSGTISDAGGLVSGVGGSLTKVGLGTLILAGTNTYTGSTLINGGTLEVTGGSALTDTNVVTVNGGGTLKVSNSETIGTLSGAGALNLASGALTTGSVGSTTFSGSSSGAGGLTKVGSSTFTVTGSQGYTGLTSVNAGQLTVNGSLDGAVTVQSGATLGGNATIAGTVTNLGAIGPGNSPGSQHYLGDYVGGGVLNMEVLTNLGGAPVNGTTHDNIDIDGNVFGTTIINLLPSGLPTVTSGQGFELVRVGGTVASNAFQLAGGSLTYNGFYYLLNYVANFSGSDDGFFLYTAPICNVDNAANACLIDSTTPQSLPIDALAGSDTLQLGGASAFNFNVAGIGTTYTNFEVFQKIGTSNATLTGAAGVAANWDIQAGTLTASTGNNIFNTSSVNVGGAGTFAIAASETIGKLSGTGATTIAAGQTLTSGDASNSSYTGTTSGAGSLTKVGSGKFSTSSLGHTGGTTVAAGELNTNGSIAGSVVINAGATLSGTNTIGGDLTNLGTIKSGNSPGTTTVVGNYVGGGVLNVEVQFNNALAASSAINNGSTHDFLNIGGTASGVTILNIIPFAPSASPDATTGNGIELVRVAGATGAGQFVLPAPVILGPYQYVLNYVPNYSGALDGYFLKSQLGAEMYGEAAMFSAGQAMTSSCFRGTDELVGDGTRDTKGRGWAKVTKGSRSTGADTGIDSDQEYSCGSGGIDLQVAGNVRMGVSGGYGNTDVDVTTLAGIGKLNGDGGMIQAFLGYAESQMFANLSVGYSNINWNFDGPLTPVTSATTGGVIGSLQAGMLWPMGDWRLGAMAELGYDGMTCSKGCLLAGTVEDIASWSGKATLRVDGKMAEGVLLPFVALSFSDSLDGTNTVRNGTAVITTDTNSSIFNAKAGITAMVGDNTAVFIDGGITEGLSNDVSGADGTAGVKIFW